MGELGSGNTPESLFFANPQRALNDESNLETLRPNPRAIIPNKPLRKALLWGWLRGL